MKIFIVMMVLLSVPFSYTYAGEEYKKDENKQSTKMEDREVIYYNHGLDLELKNGMVEAEWDKFTKGGFDWYKLVYSTTNTNPVYGEDKVIFIGSIDQRETTFKLEKGASKHYVRLCAVVLNDDYSKDRYCGKTQTLTGEYVEQYTEKKEEYKKDDKYVEDKKEYTKTGKKEVKQTGLSESMKDKIEEVIGNFVTQIEDKGYSDAQMTATINIVISRLDAFKNKTGYKEIVSYMTIVLEKYRDEYSNPLEDLQSIFDGL